jgi:predicted nucleic acid-binding Zn ribbon protein
MSDGERRRKVGPDSGPRRVGASMAKVLGRMGGSAAGSTMELVFSRWPEVVGTELAEHLTPMRIQGTVLVVGVEHPAWATRARMEAERIVARVRELGDSTITRVEVVVQRK